MFELALLNLPAVEVDGTGIGASLEANLVGGLESGRCLKEAMFVFSDLRRCEMLS